MPPAPRKRGHYEEREVRGNADIATVVNESGVVLDEVVLDPYGPLAVQIPEGVGADGTEIMAGLRSVYESGTVEQQFRNGTAALPTHSDPENSENPEAVRAVGDEPEPAEGDPLELSFEYPVHSIPAVRREAAEGGENVDEADADRVPESDQPNVPPEAMDPKEDPKKASEVVEEDDDATADKGSKSRKRSADKDDK